MNKLLATLLMAAASLSFATIATAAEGSKAAYETANNKADAEYKAASEKCNSIAGNPKDVCVEEAKAMRTHSKSTAHAEYKNTLKARTAARKDIAEADYKVAKEKCNSKTGNEKDVCIKEAKAAKIAATADATADKKVVEARKDARDDSMTGEYKVALEKCDALAGTAKDNCVSSAKAKFGK